MLLNINICDSKQKNFQLLKAQLNYNRNINLNKKKKTSAKRTEGKYLTFVMKID